VELRINGSFYKKLNKKKALKAHHKMLSGLLEHFNIFCSALCRREDKAGKEGYAAILKYCE